MQTYISILRGINVGGNRAVKMEELRELYAGLGFTDIQPYIQSGNLVFRSGKQETSELESAIAQKIFEQYHFEVPVMVLGVEILKQIVAENPFVNDPDKAEASLHVTFLAQKPSLEASERIMALNHLPDQCSISGKSVYLHCPNGYGQTKLTNNFFESKLSVTATTRNWRTVRELIRLSEKITHPAEEPIN